MLVSDIGTSSVVAVKLFVNGFSVKGVAIGQICGFASVFGITYGRGTIYVASSHPESGGILSFNYQDMLSGNARVEMVISNGSSDCDTVHVVQYVGMI